MAYRGHATPLENSPGDAAPWRDGWVPMQVHPDQFNPEVSGDQVPQGILWVVKISFIISFLKSAFDFSCKKDTAVQLVLREQSIRRKKEGKTKAK